MTNNTTKNGTNPSVHCNGHHRDIPIPGEQVPELDVGRDILWDILPQAIVEKLRQPLDSGLVSQRKAGPGAPSPTSRGVPPSTRSTASSVTAAGATTWWERWHCERSRPWTRRRER